MAKIKIPKKVKIGGVNTNINYTNNLIETAGVVALFSCYDGGPNITLGKKVEGREDFLHNAFIHELIHAMLYQLGETELNSNEVLVQSLANLLQEVIPQITE